MLGWGTVTMDADYGLYALFHSSEHPPGFNGSFYRTRKLTACWTKPALWSTRPSAAACMTKAISIIWEDAPWLFLYSEVQLTAIRTNVRALWSTRMRA
jgi:ABC-type transport system substrate-binding protein